MKLAIACDHRGFKLKKYIIKHLKNAEVIDLGTDSDKSVDYPKYGIKLGEYVVKNKCYGLAICGSGIGISIACNKVKGVRCAKVNDEWEAKMTRLDNDSNVIAISSRFPLKFLEKLIKIFIETDFSHEERHQRRVDLINNYNG